MSGQLLEFPESLEQAVSDGALTRTQAYLLELEVTEWRHLPWSALGLWLDQRLWLYHLEPEPKSLPH